MVSMLRIYNIDMYTEEQIWDSFQKGILEAKELMRKHLMDEKEDTLNMVFMIVCERMVLDQLNLSPENRERIISEKANRIYRIQNWGISRFTMDNCRDLPLNAGSLYSLIVKLLLGKDVEFEKEKAMTDYQFDICEELLEELNLIK